MANINHPNFQLCIQNSRKTLNKNKQLRVSKYLLNPSICKQCNSPIVDYEKRNNRFCSKSCSTKHSNKFANRKWSDKAKNKSIGKPGTYFGKPKELLKFYINNCPICLNDFKTKIKRKMHCSKVCFHKSISIKNLANPNCGIVNQNCHFCWHISPFAGKVFLQSSYELTLAKSLDENNIKWIRPNFISYFHELDNKQRKYFPDFYLIDYDVYLDPKNDFLINFHKNKIQYVIDQNKIKLIVLTKNQLNWDSVRQLI